MNGKWLKTTTNKQTEKKGKRCENIDVTDSPQSIFTAALPFSKQGAEFLCGLLTQTEIKQQLALLTYDTQNQVEKITSGMRGVFFVGRDECVWVEFARGCLCFEEHHWNVTHADNGQWCFSDHVSFFHTINFRLQKYKAWPSITQPNSHPQNLVARLQARIEVIGVFETFSRAVLFDVLLLLALEPVSKLLSTVTAGTGWHWLVITQNFIFMTVWSVHDCLSSVNSRDQFPKVLCKSSFFIMQIFCKRMYIKC